MEMSCGVLATKILKTVSPMI